MPGLSSRAPFVPGAFGVGKVHLKFKHKDEVKKKSMLGIQRFATLLENSRYISRDWSVSRMSQLHGCKVKWDEGGSIHVEGRNLADVLFMQGFVQASHRLFQMDLARRLALGTVSELYGQQTVMSDRFARSLNLRRLASADLAALDAESRDMLDAFTAGINAYIDSAQFVLPSQYWLLRGALPLWDQSVTVLPWEPQHSLLIMRLQALEMSAGWDSDLARWILAHISGDSRLGDMLLHRTGLASGSDASAEGRPTSPNSAITLPTLGASAWVMTSASPTGSNSTQFLDSFLVGNLHLSRAKNSQDLSFLMTLSSSYPQLQVSGVSTPGIPLIAQGHNEFISWVSAPAAVDTQDLFVEAVDLNPSASPSPSAAEASTCSSAAADGEECVDKVHAATTPSAPSDSAAPDVCSAKYLAKAALGGDGNGAVESRCTGQQTERIVAHTVRYGFFRSSTEINITVLETSNGPVISEGLPDELYLSRVISHFGGPSADYKLALSSQALKLPLNLRYLWKLNVATNWTSFLDALSEQQALALNVLYADAQHNIGYATTGRIPTRFEGHSGEEPVFGVKVPGWAAPSASAASPSPPVLNPPAGLIVLDDLPHPAFWQSPRSEGETASVGANDNDSYSRRSSSHLTNRLLAVQAGSADLVEANEAVMRDAFSPTSLLLRDIIMSIKVSSTPRGVGVGEADDLLDEDDPSPDLYQALEDDDIIAAVQELVKDFDGHYNSQRQSCSQPLLSSVPALLETFRHTLVMSCVRPLGPTLLSRFISGGDDFSPLYTVHPASRVAASWIFDLIDFNESSADLNWLQVRLGSRESLIRAAIVQSFRDAEDAFGKLADVYSHAKNSRCSKPRIVEDFGPWQWGRVHTSSLEYNVQTPELVRFATALGPSPAPGGPDSVWRAIPAYESLSSKLSPLRVNDGLENTLLRFFFRSSSFSQTGIGHQIQTPQAQAKWFD